MIKNTNKWGLYLSSHFKLLLSIICLLGLVNLCIAPLGIVIWPDSIGYLGPASDYITKGYFTHWAGRGFLYPAVLMILLELCQNNPVGIVIFQKILLAIIYLVALGIISNVASRKRLTPPIFNGIILFCYASLVFNPALIGLTHTLMPEIFYAFLLTLLIAFLYALRFINSVKLRYMLILLSTLTGGMLPLVKPHFIVGSIMIPIIVFFLSVKLQKKNSTYFNRIFNRYFINTPLPV